MAEIIRAQRQGSLMLLTDSDGKLSYLPHAGSGYQAGTGNSPGPGPNPGGSRFIWPFDLSLVTSEYGMRNGRLHAGIDFGNGIANREGSDIKSAAAGTVQIANTTNSHGGYGNAVVVDHGDGLATLYGHMRFLPSGAADVSVSVGQKVEQGQRLGGVGKTGASFGVHLHFETHEGGYRWYPSSRDPRLFFAKYN